MLPLSPDRLKALFSEARAHEAAGRLNEAIKRFSMILQAAPKSAEAHFHMGRLALRLGNPDRAWHSLKTARALKPAEPIIWRQMAEVLHKLDDAPRSRKFLQEAKQAKLPTSDLLALRDRLTPARSGGRVSTGNADPKAIEQAIRALQAGKPDQAETRARALLKAHPKLPVLHNILGSALLAQKKDAAGIAALEAAIDLQPDYVEARDTLARALLRQGQPAKAEPHFRRVLSERPDHTPALGGLGLTLLRLGQNEPGIAALRQALEADPKQSEIRLALGTALTTTRTASEAVALLQEAIDQGDTRPVVHLRLAQALARAGDNPRAKAHFEQAEAAGAPAIASHAIHLQSLGDFEGAEARFRKAIALAPRNGEAYRTFGATYRYGPDDPLLAQMQTLFKDPTLGDESRMHLGFALARAAEQNKDFAHVFQYLRPANELMAKHYPFDMAARTRIVEGTRAAFARTDFTRQIEGTTDYAPIFVTGMPRSGTTLVEQILSSHTEVTGAGEVGHAVPLISKAMLTEDGTGYRPFDDLGDTAIRNFGKEIANHLHSLAPDTPRVTDKSIQTYMLIGAIRLAMPNARFVLVRRDPRDLLFSIYKNFFREGTHSYAYDLRTLGQYYRQFDDMVRFWNTKLPGQIHEIHYEDLISDPETQTRALLNACDLDWQDACLSFHENTRQVSTLSVHQVRQPIYSSSLQAWQRHEEELSEMITALGDLV